MRQKDKTMFDLEGRSSKLELKVIFYLDTECFARPVREHRPCNNLFLFGHQWWLNTDIFKNKKNVCLNFE